MSYKRLSFPVMSYCFARIFENVLRHDRPSGTVLTNQRVYCDHQDMNVTVTLQEGQSSCVVIKKNMLAFKKARDCWFHTVLVYDSFGCFTHKKKTFFLREGQECASKLTTRQHIFCSDSSASREDSWNRQRIEAYWRKALGLWIAKVNAGPLRRSISNIPVATFDTKCLQRRSKTAAGH